MDADGALFDAALLSAVAAFSHRKLYLKLIMLAVYFFIFWLKGNFLGNILVDLTPYVGHSFDPNSGCTNWTW